MMSTLLIGLITFTACKKDTASAKTPNATPSIIIDSHNDNSEMADGYIETIQAAVSDSDHDFAELEVIWYVDEEVVCDWNNPTSSGTSSWQYSWVATYLG